jgi:hypothetical protein
MRHLLLVALAIGFAATLPGGQAEAAKKVHKFHHAQNAYRSPRAVPVNPDPTGGNAAAGGNNASSMSGSNSAAENANGRTSGGRN